jgi:hypothetical protein
MDTLKKVTTVLLSGDRLEVFDLKLSSIQAHPLVGHSLNEFLRLNFSGDDHRKVDCGVAELFFFGLAVLLVILGL